VGTPATHDLRPRPLGLAVLLVFDLILFAPLLGSGTVISSHDFVRAHHPWRMTDLGILEAENRLLSDPAASGETTLVRFHGVPRAFFWNPWVSSGAMGPILLAQGFLSPFTLLPAVVLPEAGIETGILFLKFQFAFIAMYVFLRSRRFSDAAAATGAAAWAFSTGLTVWGLWMQSSVAVTYPLLLMAVYALVFRFYMRIAVPHYALFLLAGLLPWTWFSSSLREGTNSIVSGAVGDDGGAVISAA